MWYLPGLNFKLLGGFLLVCMTSENLLFVKLKSDVFCEEFGSVEFKSKSEKLCFNPVVLGQEFCK